MKTQPSQNFSRPFGMSLKLLGSGEELEYLVENLAMLLASGMGLNQALSGVSQDIKSHPLRKMLGRLRDDIESGIPFSAALERTPILPDYVARLVRIGEESGQLEENLRVISHQQQKDHLLKTRVRSAMLYPLLVLIVAVVIGLSISWFVLPRLSTVFAGLQLELPLLTKWLIGAGMFLSDYGLIAVPGAITFFILLIFFLFYFPKTNALGQRLLFSLPGSGPLLREIELTRFGYLLGNLLGAGLPIVESANLLATATGMKMYKSMYVELARRLEDGDSFEQIFRANPSFHALIPGPVQQMVISGEKSGSLADSLIRIGKNFEEKTESTAKNLTVLLEPILLVIVWLAVVAVALAVILPLYRLLGSLNR